MSKKIASLIEKAKKAQAQAEQAPAAENQPAPEQGETGDLAELSAQVDKLAMEAEAAVVKPTILPDLTAQESGPVEQQTEAFEAGLKAEAPKKPAVKKHGKLVVVTGTVKEVTPAYFRVLAGSTDQWWKKSALEAYEPETPKVGDEIAMEVTISMAKRKKVA